MPQSAQLFSILSLLIYPVKSLGGIKLDQINATFEGFQYDRRWMIVDENGKFLTQREHPIMVKFKCKLTDSTVDVSYNNEQISIPFDKTLSRSCKVSVWDSELIAQEVDEDIDAWFSSHLGQKVRLVKMTELSHRIKKFTKAPFESPVSFADGYPFLILGSQSLQNLNNILDEPVDYNRFRPNIIVQTQTEHEEDNWEEFTIGSARFKNIKPCARCIVTTINHNSAEKGAEPLKTLSKYRQKDNKIYFGSNLMLLEEGLVSIHDSITFP